MIGEWMDDGYKHDGRIKHRRMIDVLLDDGLMIICGHGGLGIERYTFPSVFLFCINYSFNIICRR